MSDHTPGPWRIEEMVPDRHGINTKGGYNIVTDEYDVVADIPKGAPIRKLEDARLIAAAPELLGALNAIVLPMREWLEDNPGDVVISPETTSTALRIGLAAVDKAISP